MSSERPLHVVNFWHLRFGLLIVLLGFCIVLAVPFTVGSGLDTRTSIGLLLLGVATAIFGVTVVSIPVASALQDGRKL